MENLQPTFDAVLDVLARVFHTVMEALGSLESWGRVQLAPLNLDPQVDGAVLIAIALVALLIILRLFGGLLRAVLAVLLILFAVQVVRHLA